MSCSLCALALPKNPIREGKELFCCSGCLTVFQIVGLLQDFRQHPLFQEALKAGVISNPEWVKNESEREEPRCEQKKCHLHIEGMWCPSCAEAIQLILMRQKGVLRCVVDYATDLALITFNPAVISKEHIEAKIQKLGYLASEILCLEKSRLSLSLWLRFSIAAFCALNIMMFSYPLYTSYFGISTDGYAQTLGWLSFYLSLPLISYSAWPIWRRLFISFKSGLFGMETLIFLGVSTAFVISTYHLLRHDPSHIYFDSMSMVLTFVLLGKILEKKAKFSTKEILLHLSHSLPRKGYKRLASGEYRFVPLKEIIQGDLLLARTGEKIVLDGIVQEGSAYVDEAIMTGEAMPLHKSEGSQVIGGSVVKQGSLLFRVVKDQEHSLVSQIMQLIESDIAQKNESERLIDSITRFFVPTVLLMAFFAFFEGGLIRALTLVMISCPCALGIAAPLALSRLLYLFAEKGAIVRNRNQIHLLGRNPFFVFDKTGTLTTGKFQITQGLEPLSEELRAILKALVVHATHPVAAALSDHLHCSPVPINPITEHIGRGMEGEYGGKTYLLGSERFVCERGVLLPKPVQTTAQTPLFFTEDQRLLTILFLSDTLRSNLPQVEGGILSGDSPELVAEVASQCGLLWGKGRLDPLEKREEILKMKQLGRPIVMVGDGVNDAPAMTAADLGISVMSATEVATAVSDILLTSDHLNVLPTLCQITKKCQKIIHQNLFWAFIYNTVGVICAFFGYLNPLFAALAMATSSLSVTFNSLRLRQSKEKKDVF